MTARCAPVGGVQDSRLRGTDGFLDGYPPWD
jgi:hypothetical protein